MKFEHLVVFFLILISALGCAKKVVANISESRKAYITSQPHGWVEVELFDDNIPSREKPKDLTPEEAAEWRPSPPSCHLVVYLNNERFLSEDIFPYGQAPPYIVETGFRFPAPIGIFAIDIYYFGCDVEQVEGETQSDPSLKILSSEIEIVEDHVSTVFTSGDSIKLDPPREYEVITLDDIYRQLKAISNN